MERLLRIVIPVTGSVSEWAVASAAGLGSWCAFVGDALAWTFRRPFRIQLLLQQMELIGIKSTGIVALTAFFTGAVFALQAGNIYALFNVEIMVGATVALSLAREMAPVFAALMVTARACSAMAAELGSMRVTEQIDALTTMAIDPIQYLVVPRLWATTLMLPLLTMIFNVVGCIGGYVVGIYLLGIHDGPYLERLYYYLDGDDIIGGLIKSAFFGFAIAAVSCYQGFWSQGGAAGVGRATTRAVVISAVTVLILDYFLTTWILEFFTS